MENQPQHKCGKCERGVDYKDYRGEVKGKVHLAGRFKYLRKALQDEDAGYQVECLVRGLGENEAIRQIYVEHAQAAIDSIAKK